MDMVFHTKSGEAQQLKFVPYRSALRELGQPTEGESDEEGEGETMMERERSYMTERERRKLYEVV